VSALSLPKVAAGVGYGSVLYYTSWANHLPLGQGDLLPYPFACRRAVAKNAGNEIAVNGGFGEPEA
jgi:hypothetical protein